MSHDYTVGAMCAGTGAFELGLSAVLPTRVVWHGCVPQQAAAALAHLFESLPVEEAISPVRVRHGALG